MFERMKNTLRKWGVKLGLIEELKRIDEHKQIDVDEEAYARIARNKEIYSGTVPEWHLNQEVMNSNGDLITRNRLTMGMGKVLAQKMAGLIFNEKTNISFGDKATEEFVMGVLNSNDFFKNFQRYLEYGIALGGMAIKVYEHNRQIKLAYAAADAFYPVGNDSENVDEAIFVSKEYQDGKYYTLLEFNEWVDGVYTVKNELYESDTSETLGTKVNLNKIYEGMETGPIGMPKLTRPLFSYFKLNTANNKNLSSPLGISIFENSYDTLYLLDFMYDFWYNEFDLGRRRIMVDRSMLRPFPDAHGNIKMAFDTKETVFTPVNAEGQTPIDMSVELRATDIIESINALLDILAMQTGLSAGTFTFDGKSVKTATEVVSENSMTFQTKNSHETLVEAGIKDLIKTIIEVGKTFNLYDGKDDFEVTIDFDDSIAQDRDQNLAYYALAVNSKLIPPVIAIQRIFNVTEKEAKEWVTMIAEHQKTMTPEFESLLGME